jgi:hypothetical protein
MQWPQATEKSNHYNVHGNAPKQHCKVIKELEPDASEVLEDAPTEHPTETNGDAQLNP